MTTVQKFLPCDPSLSDDEAKAQGRITGSQEEAIQLALGEIGRSNGVLIGDEPGFGKTLIGAEVILRAGFTRALLIALPDTHKQWHERILLQSNGSVEVRVMNGTKKGREQFKAFMAGENGIYVAGSHYLAAQDWESVPQFLPNGKPRWKIVKKTGFIDLKERAEGSIGPVAEPIQERKSSRKNVFRRTATKPLDAVLFDEVQLIANKASQARSTVLSIKAKFRVAMSGTWFLNSIANMWSITRWVWPGDNPETGLPYVETSHDRWKKQYLVQEVVYGKNGRALETARGNTVLKTTGERVPGEFVSTLPAYIRRENEQVPEPAVIFCDPSNEQRAQIEDLERDLMTWVLGWDGEEAPLVIDLPPLLHMRLRQVAIAELSLDENDRVRFEDDAASAKLGPLRGLIDNRYAGQPVTIYTDSKIGAHFIAQRMQRAGYDARAWTGDLSRPRREELKQQFLRGEFPYLIATIQSFGTGLDGFQRACNKVIWISKAVGNPAANEQAIRRFFRPGMTQAWGGFEHVEILMNDSVDVSTFEALIAKAWQVRVAMNGGVMTEMENTR